MQKLQCFCAEAGNASEFPGAQLYAIRVALLKHLPQQATNSLELGKLSFNLHVGWFRQAVVDGLLTHYLVLKSSVKLRLSRL
eukprot:3523108-Amphidinium_carterae.2